MGLFGGSSSKKTYVTTNTTTNIRDIGFTGQQAVDLAGIVQAGVVETAQINAGLMETLFLGASEYAQELVGGASKITEDAYAVSGKVTERGMEMAEILAGERSSLERVVPYLVLGGGALLVFMWMK